MRILLSCLLLLSSFALATPETIRDWVNETVRQRHPLDKPEDWRKLGPEAPGVIMELYRTSKSTYHQLRLLQGLAWFHDPAALAFLKEVAEKSDQKSVLRAAAVRSVGSSAGEAEAEFLQRFLENDDPDTRVAAALSLRGLKGAEAQASLDAFRKRERLPWVLQKAEGKPLPKATVAPEPAVSAFERAQRGTWNGTLQSAGGTPPSQVVFRVVTNPAPALELQAPAGGAAAKIQWTLGAKTQGGEPGATFVRHVLLHEGKKAGTLEFFELSSHAWALLKFEANRDFMGSALAGSVLVGHPTAENAKPVR